MWIRSSVQRKVFIKSTKGKYAVNIYFLLYWSQQWVSNNGGSNPLLSDSDCEFTGFNRQTCLCISPDYCHLPCTVNTHYPQVLSLQTSPSIQHTPEHTDSWPRPERKQTSLYRLCQHVCLQKHYSLLPPAVTINANLNPNVSLTHTKTQSQVKYVILYIQSEISLTTSPLPKTNWSCINKESFSAEKIHLNWISARLVYYSVQEKIRHQSKKLLQRKNEVSACV